MHCLIAQLLDVDRIYLQVQHLLENHFRGLLLEGYCRQEGPKWGACNAGPGISR